MKSIYIKPKGKRLEVFDAKKRSIGMVCDSIYFQPMDFLFFHLKIVDDMIHIWSDYEFEIELLKTKNTLIISF